MKCRSGHHRFRVYINLRIRRKARREPAQRSHRLLTVVARRRRRGRGLDIGAADLEDNLHVVAGAPAADAPVEVVLGRGADEVVIVAREELQTIRLRRKRPEGDGEVHRFARLVADRYYPRTGVRYPACLVLLFGHLQNAEEESCSWLTVGDDAIIDRRCATKPLRPPQHRSDINR